MNILWVCNECPFPINSGGKVVIANRLRELSKYHKIYFITECDRITTEIQNSLDEICEYYVIHFPSKRKAIKKVTDFLFFSNNLGKYRNYKIAKSIKEILERKSMDLIIFEFSLSYINMPSEMKKTNIPIIINQHNIEFDTVKSKIYINEISFFLKLYACIESQKLYWFEKLLSKEISIRAMSFVSLDDMKKYRDIFKIDNKELFVSPIGTKKIDNRIIDILKGDNRKKIVYVASFDYGPNIHGAEWFCNKVMPIILENIQNVVLYLVGKNPDPRVRILANKNIVVTGSVDDVKPYFKVADIIIVPIFYGGGVKTKLIEAGEFCKPVVSTTSGYKGTKYTDRYDIMIENTKEGFAKVCIDILNNYEKYIYLGVNMKITTEQNYMWDKIGNEFCEQLNKLKQGENK